VSGDGPREDPTPTPAVRNSRLATLSARDIVAGDILPRGDGPSPRRDGGLGITIDPVGVEDADCLGGKAGVMSPTSENKSPSKKKCDSFYKYSCVCMCVCVCVCVCFFCS